MNHSTKNHEVEAGKGRAGELAQARIILLALVFFFMGLAVGAFWFSRKTSVQAVSPIEASVDPAGVIKVNAKPQSAPPPSDAIDPAALDAVKRSIPNVTSTSLEAGTQILREAAVAEFQQTVQELQARQKKAEENFIKGQNNQSAEQQKIATQELRELQAEQMAKLSQIAAKSKAQIDAFHRLKGTPQ